MEPRAHNQRRVRVPLRKALCTHIHTRVGILVRERSLNVSHYLKSALLLFVAACFSRFSALPATVHRSPLLG